MMKRQKYWCKPKKKKKLVWLYEKGQLGYPDKYLISPFLNLGNEKSYRESSDPVDWCYNDFGWDFGFWALLCGTPLQMALPLKGRG